MNNVTELADWGRDGLEGHVMMRTIFILEALFEPYDCANLKLTVIPSQTAQAASRYVKVRKTRGVFLSKHAARACCH